MENRTTRVEDIETAHQLADAEKPYRELSIHAGQLGLQEVSLEMAKRADKVSDELNKANGIDLVDETVETNNEIDRERLRSIIDAGEFLAMVYITGDELRNLDTKYTSGQIVSGMNDFTSTGKLSSHSSLRRSWQLKSFIDYQPWEDRKFAETDASEAVIISEINDLNPDDIFSDAINDQEKVCLIKYCTLTGAHGSKFKYFDHVDRPGVTLTLNLLLPKSKSDEILALVRRNPEQIRDIVDIVIHDKLGISAEWAGMPPYADWKEQNGGHNKIALVDNSSKKDYSLEILGF